MLRNHHQKGTVRATQVGDAHQNENGRASILTYRDFEKPCLRQFSGCFRDLNSDLQQKFE